MFIIKKHFRVLTHSGKFLTKPCYV